MKYSMASKHLRNESYGRYPTADSVCVSICVCDCVCEHVCEYVCVTVCACVVV